MLIHNAVITGSLTYNGVDISDITGSEGSISALNSFSASMLSYTASNNLASASFSTRVTNLESTASVLTTASASFSIVSQSYASASGSLSTRVTNTESTGSSLVTASGSFSTRVTNLESTGSSLVAASASFSTRTTNLEATASVLTTASASFSVVSASFASTSGSLSTRVTTLESASSSFAQQSGSNSVRLTNLESTASVLTTASASFSVVSSSFSSTSQSLSNRVTIVEGSYATTGSNVFVGNQGLTSTSNAISFTSTGSLYIDGGARITKDLYVSGTSYFNNVTIYGTQSVNYITSSQLNIGTNIITVNTDTPTVRYGGLAVYDSGSTGLTGSILWDSENNHWIYTNPSASTYSGGMLISGPRASARGCEVGTTSCAVMMGQGGDHITSSAIFHYGNATCFYGNSFVSSSGAACFGGNTTIAGNLGVGTVTPGQLIDVYKTSNDAVIRVTSCTAGAYIVADSCTDGYYGLVLQSNSNQRWFIGGYTTSDLTFKTSQAAGDEWLRINRTSGIACFASTICAPSIVFCSSVNSGYTPIKVCNPNAGSSAYAEILINNNTTNLAGLFYNSSTRSVDGGVCSLTLYNDSATGNLRLRTGNNIVLATGSPVSDRLVINTNGCVGINTTSPGFLLDLKMSGALRTDGLAIRRSTNDNHQLGLWTTGGEMYIDAVTDNVLAAGVLVFRRSLDTGANFSESMRITSTGIVCFACQVCTPNLVVNGSTACVNINRTDGTPAVLQLGNTQNFFQIQFTCTGGQRIAFINGAPSEFASFYGATGIACFSGAVCSAGLVSSGEISLNGNFAIKLNSVVAVSSQQLQYQNNGTNKWQLYLNTANDSFNIYNSTNTADRLTILENGNVGLGVTPITAGACRRHFQLGYSTCGAIVSLGTNVCESCNPRVFSGQYDLGFASGISTGNMLFYTNDSERLRITSTGEVLLNSTSGLYGGGSANESRLLVVGVPPSNDVDRGLVSFMDCRAYNTTCLGAKLMLGASYTSGGAMTFLSGLAGLKENTTDSNYAGALAFYTRPNGAGTSERMRITSGGDVLFRGTYNPYTSTNRGNITLNGTADNIIAFTNNTSPKGYILNDGTNFDFWNEASGYIRFATTNSERMRIASTGIACFACQVCAPAFVGGTVNGTSITGTSMTVATDCSGVIVDVASRHGLMKYFNYSTGLVGCCTGTDGSISTWLGRFAGSITSPTAVYQDLVVNNAGNVGIGITSPQAKLDILSTLNVQASNNSDIPYINFSNNGRVYNWGRVGGLLQGDGDGALYFSTKLGGDVTEKMRINSLGNVGVGTQTPCGSSGERTIHLAGNSSTNATIYVSRDTYARTILGTNANGGITGTQSNHNLYVVTNDTARLFIDNTGISCFACTVCAPSFRSTGLVIGDISSFSHYQQKFNAAYYAGSVVIANNSSGGAASNWVNLARIDDWSSANSRIIAKVTVMYISATSDQGNEHVGYAMLNYAGTSYACPMTLSTGSTFGNSNVGTIRWCSGCLQYCAPSGGYFLGAIKTELATKDGAVVTLFCGTNSY